MNTCIFCQIAAHTEPKDFVYEDENIMVFEDLHPAKPVHLLIVPKKHMTDFLDLTDDELARKLNEVLKKMIKENGLETKGYRISVNGGGAQKIDHMHYHLMGPMGQRV